MIQDRYKTSRIRARYIRAMQAIPLPLRNTGTTDPVLPFDLVGLPVLATETIDERAVRYSLVVGQARFRLTFKDIEPNLIGHVIGLDTADPRLTVATPLHLEWGIEHTESLVAAARSIWEGGARACNG